MAIKWIPRVCQGANGTAAGYYNIKMNKELAHIVFVRHVYYRRGKTTFTFFSYIKDK